MLRQRFAEQLSAGQGCLGTAQCAGGLGDRAFVVMGRQEKAQTPLAVGIAYKVSWAE